jgi:hypothetical protein
VAIVAHAHLGRHVLDISRLVASSGGLPEVALVCNFESGLPIEGAKIHLMDLEGTLRRVIGNLTKTARLLRSSPTFKVWTEFR